MRSRPNDNGYACVTLFGPKKSPRVHCLVLEAFTGPRPEGAEGCHNNGDKTDNRLENLRWDTRTGNILDAIRHGTLPFGEKKALAKLTDAAVSEILASTERATELAPHYGVSPKTITAVRRGEAWKHVPRSAERDTALTHLAPWARDAAIIATIAQARNRALSAAGYSHKVYLPSSETVHGMVNLAARKARLGDAPVYFTPKDHCMVFVVQTPDGENVERRPARILIADRIATDKRGRVRRWATSSAALAEARRIERDVMGTPRRKRVGAKAEPAPPRCTLGIDGGMI